MNRTRHSALGTRLAAAIAAAVLLGACARDSGTTATLSSGTPSSSVVSVTPTGKVIVVEMYTDGIGNYFKPKEIEAQRGDIVRFVLKSGVHNVNFLADSNPGKTGLPKTSDFLQLPGQEFDVLVTLAPGHYYFQCDPHALLGMVGTLEVEDVK